MKLGRCNLSGLCIITDRKASGLSCEEMAATVLDAGADWIQYREKEKSRKESYYEAVKLRELTRKAGAFFVVNDHADIARAVDADGVHLGQDDLPIKEARKVVGKRIIGISTHSLFEAGRAEEEGADYIGFGPVFRTTTKDAGEPKGLDLLREIGEQVKIPVVAIGGISPENLFSALDAGADGVAVASAVFRGNVYENVRAFMEALRGR